MLDDSGMETAVTPKGDPRTRLLGLALVAALALAGGAGAWTLFSGRAHRETGPPVAAKAPSSIVAPSAGEPLPDFSLTDQSGRAVTLADLRGKVWVADFIFTRCPNVCPDLTRRMLAIRKRLDEAGGSEVVSVSITVDPKYDTPKVMAEYAHNFQAAPSWLFLTGEPRAVYGLVNNGFRLAMADPDAGAPGHSNRFVLVDAQGRIRATRLGTEDGIVEAIVEDALALDRERRG
jgi:protein SCO1/2